MQLTKLMFAFCGIVGRLVTLAICSSNTTFLALFAWFSVKNVKKDARRWKNEKANGQIWWIQLNIHWDKHRRVWFREKTINSYLGTYLFINRIMLPTFPKFALNWTWLVQSEPKWKKMTGLANVKMSFR